jgi:hypothetical protein
MRANFAGAIYGTITATAVVAATASHEEPAGTILVTAVATLAVFWIAHVYSEVMARHLEGHRPSLALVTGVVVRELPILESPAPALLLLLLGALGVVEEALAVNLALWAGVAQLAFLGVLYARQLGRSWPVTLLTAAFDGALGVAIIGLKAVLH